MILAYTFLSLVAFILVCLGLRAVINYMANWEDGFGSDLKDLILGILLIDNALFALGIIYILKNLADK